MSFKFLAAAALLSASLAAHADTVTFTLVSSTESVAYTGGTVTYDATVSAPSSNGAAVYLNGDSFNVTAPVTLDDSDFFSNFPLSLAPGTSFTGDLFTLTVPSGTFGNFLGTFTLLGGADGNATGQLGTANFNVAATPEPSSFALLGTGLLGIAGVVRKRFA